MVDLAQSRTGLAKDSRSDLWVVTLVAERARSFTVAALKGEPRGSEDSAGKSLADEGGVDGVADHCTDGEGDQS